MASKTAAELIAAAQAAGAEAQAHKRKAGQHRRAAQAARERQAQLERQCAALGIEVIYDNGLGSGQADHQTPGEGTPPWPATTRPSSTSPR